MKWCSSRFTIETNLGGGGSGTWLSLDFLDVLISIYIYLFKFSISRRLVIEVIFCFSAWASATLRVKERRWCCPQRSACGSATGALVPTSSSTCSLCSTSSGPTTHSKWYVTFPGRNVSALDSSVHWHIERGISVLSFSLLQSWSLWRLVSVGGPDVFHFETHLLLRGCVIVDRSVCRCTVVIFFLAISLTLDSVEWIRLYIYSL